MATLIYSRKNEKLKIKSKQIGFYFTIEQHLPINLEDPVLEKEQASPLSSIHEQSSILAELTRSRVTCMQQQQQEKVRPAKIMNTLPID
jgi:hypothetical protein